MEIEAIKSIAAALAFALGVIFPAKAVGKIGTAAMEAIGRNPESANKVQSSMFIPVALAESMAVFALLTVILIIMLIK